MTMRMAFLFPGQGSQTEGMLHGLPVSEPCVKEVFRETVEVLGMPVDGLDAGEKLSSTVYTQICLLIAGVVSGKRLLDRGIKADFVAGHSVGAFAASVISGVLSFKQALELVHTRGNLMREAYPRGYGMAALLGMTEGRMRQYLNEHNKTHASLYLANINTADQQVIAGEMESIRIFIDYLPSGSIRKAQILNTSVPSHCELLDSVSVALKERLSALCLREPSIPYASNHTGRLLDTAEAIREDLWISVAKAVRWYDVTSLLYELGTGVFIEMEPSGVLAKMAESSFPDAKIIAMEENSIEAVSWLWNGYQGE